MSNYQVAQNTRDDKLEIYSGKLPKIKNLGLQMELELLIKGNVNIELRNTHLPIEVNGEISGDLDIFSDDGDVTIENTNNIELFAKVQDGEIRCNNCKINKVNDKELNATYYGGSNKVKVLIEDGNLTVK